MHKGPELADILSLSIIQQHLPKLQFILCLKTRTNANSTKGKIHLLSLSCNISGVGLFSNASSIEKQAHLQKCRTTLNGLSLKINKQTKSDCETWHSSWNISFGKLLAKLFLKILINSKFCQSRQACQTAGKTQERERVARDDVLGSSYFPPTCWDLQDICMEGPFIARSGHMKPRFPEELKKSYGNLN